MILPLQVTVSQITSLCHQTRLYGSIWFYITLYWPWHHLGQLANTYVYVCVRVCVCTSDHLINFDYLVNLLALLSSQLINAIRAEPSLLCSLLFLEGLAACLTQHHFWANVECRTSKALVNRLQHTHISLNLANRN